MREAHIRERGFTLIELSIVLVIIGLIVGGVLVGQDLIRAATVRAQVSQIEKFNTAVNTFRDKYGFLPGDIKDPDATNFGFTPRGSLSGEGDGNGVIEGRAGDVCGFCPGSGEQLVFWRDLSTAHLIDQTFTMADPANAPAAFAIQIPLYFPSAKIGGGNYVYVWAGGFGVGWGGSSQTGSDSRNYYGISVVSVISGWSVTSTPGLTVAQAQAIDKKMDDGLPQSGGVTALYLDWSTSNFTPVWAGSGGQTGGSYTTAVSGAPGTCFDNGGNAGTPQQYSVEISNGANVNCALSFRFQ